MTWPTHPAAELFPLLDDARLAELAEDIAANGLREPLWLWDDPDDGTVLLDGRNRLAACEKAGVKVTTRTYEGDDPIGFVLSQNLHRRHLTTGQRAAVAAAIRPLYREQAKARQEATQFKDGQAPVSQNSGEPSRRKSAEQAGEQVGVSHWSVESYERIEKERPDLAEKVRAGEMTISSALQVVRGQTDEDPLAKVQRLSNEERVAQIKDLADQGYRLTQMAEKLGVSEGYLRNLVSQHGLEVPDQTIGKARRHDPNRIVSETIATLEGLAMGLELLNGRVEELDPEQVEYWATSLSKSLRPLNRLRKQLKEVAHDQG